MEIVHKGYRVDAEGRITGRHGAVVAVVKPDTYELTFCCNLTLHNIATIMDAATRWRLAKNQNEVNK